MKKNRLSFDLCWRLRPMLSLLCCLSVNAFAGGVPTRESQEIMIGSNGYLFVRYETKGAPGSLLLGLRNTDSKTNELRPTIELLSLQNADAASVDADVWISKNSQSICLLLGRAVGGNIADYYLFMYKLDPQSLAIRRYRGEAMRIAVLVAGKTVERERRSPLSVKQLLVARLDPRSPKHVKTFSVTQVRTISNVRLKDASHGGCMVVGILNNEFTFRLDLVIQENDESVSGGEIYIEPMHQAEELKP